MTKSELALKLAKANPHLTRRDTELLIATFFDQIITALCRGDRIELRDFGTFSVKRQRAVTRRNPRTGEFICVGEKHFLKFKTGKALRKRVNDASGTLLRTEGGEPSPSRPGRQRMA